MEIKNAYAVYTGGNIWLFYGELEDGNHFLTDDNGITLILDTSAENLDESTWMEWQEKHLVRELFHKERYEFCCQLFDWLMYAPDEYRGGITDEELETYKTWVYSDQF